MAPAMSANPALASDVGALLSAVRARLVYTHKPMDFSHTQCFA
jgi:hypothetical protein